MTTCCIEPDEPSNERCRECGVLMIGLHAHKQGCETGYRSIGATLSRSMGQDMTLSAGVMPPTRPAPVAEPDVRTPRMDALYSSIDGKLPSIQFGEMFAHARQLERENADLWRQIDTVIADLRHDICELIACTEKLEGQLAAERAELKRISPLYTAACIGQKDAEAALAAERAAREAAEETQEDWRQLCEQERQRANQAEDRVADSAEALRRMTIAADGWAATAKALEQKLAAIDAARKGEEEK